jgi:hypothetical protein
MAVLAKPKLLSHSEGVTKSFQGHPKNRSTMSSGFCHPLDWIPERKWKNT